MDYPTIDHRGADFAQLGKRCLDGMKTVFKTDAAVIIYPASGTGAWEAALVNLVEEGDLVLMVETGHFANLWKKMAERLGVATEFRHCPPCTNKGILSDIRCQIAISDKPDCQRVHLMLMQPHQLAEGIAIAEPRLIDKVVRL